MINGEELENKINGNFGELRHRRISALGTAPGQGSEAEVDASFRLRQHGEESRLAGEPGRVTNFLRDIENSSKKLQSMDMLMSDIDPSGRDMSIQGPPTFRKNLGKRRHSQMDSSYKDSTTDVDLDTIPNFHQILPHILDTERGHKSSTEVFPSPNRSKAG